MTKLISLNHKVQPDHTYPAGVSSLHAISFTHSDVERFARDLPKGLRAITATYKRALQRHEQGDISRKELRQLALDFRNYAHEIRGAGRGSFQKVSRKIESMAFGLEKRARADLGPSSVRPVSEILTPEIDSVLRKVATSEAVQEALNTRNADTVYQHLRRYSHYAKTPSGNTVIFLASLESGRRALVEHAKATKCETIAPVAAMTPRDGLTLLTHYLTEPQGLQIALKEGLRLNGGNVAVESQRKLLISYHETRDKYLAETREQLKTIALEEGREDLAHSPESIDTVIRSVFGLSEDQSHLLEHAALVGLGSIDVMIPWDLFENVSAYALNHLSEYTLGVLAEGSSPDLQDLKTRKALTRRLLTQPWSSIVTPDSVTRLGTFERYLDTIAAPDPKWSVALELAHVHPLYGAVVPKSFNAVVPDGYNIYSANDVLRAIGKQGLTSFVSNATDEVKARMARFGAEIERYSNGIDSARTLLEGGCFGEARAILDSALQSSGLQRSRYRSSFHRLTGSAVHTQTSLEIDRHEIVLLRARSRMEQLKVLLKGLQEAKSAEDVVGALFDSSGGSGTFEESHPDTFARRKDHTLYKSNPRLPSIGIIDNPLGSLYSVGDGDSALTNLRYDGPGERRTPTAGVALWLDGDRLSSSEIVMSHDIDLRKTPQALHDMVILDERSGGRRFALSPDSLLSWLITKHHAAVTRALGHDIPTSMRMVAGVQYTFVDWPDSGTLQPKSIRSIAEILREYGIQSAEISSVLVQFDSFYRAAPDYETKNPLHAHMPLACIESPALMERYLAVASTIRHHSNELSTGISTLLKLSENRGEDSSTVLRAIRFMEAAFKFLLVPAQDSNHTLRILRQILNSEEFLKSLRSAIVREKHPELFSATSETTSYPATSSRWETALEHFFLSAYAGHLQSKLSDAGVFVFTLRVTASDGPNQCSAELGSTFITDVRREHLCNVNVSVDVDRFLGTSEEERYSAFLGTLQEYGLVRQKDKSNSFINVKPTGRQSPMYDGDNKFLSGITPEDPSQKVAQLIKHAFERHGYVDLEAVLNSYDAPVEALNVEFYVTVAREIAGRLVTNIPPKFAESQSCSGGAVLPQPSYVLMREALFANIEDEDFGDQMQELVRTLYERDKIVRFWDLAIGPESNPAAAAKFNQALLESLASIAGNIDANIHWFEFLRGESHQLP